MQIKKNITNVNFTPNGMREVRGVVLHSMWGTYAGSIAWFKNPDAQASAHFLVSATGEITQMVEEKDMAWHAGVIDQGKPPSWVLPNPNFYTIGIELEDKRDANWQYPEAQRKATRELCDYLKTKYNLSNDRFLLHRNLVPSRRSDPVGAFSYDWALGTGGGDMNGDYYKGYDLTNKESMKVAVDVMVRVQQGEFVNKNDVKSFEIEGHTVGWYITEVKNREEQVNRLRGEKESLQIAYDALKDGALNQEAQTKADRELIKKQQEELDVMGKAIGELNHEITTLENEIDVLEKTNEQLKQGSTASLTFGDVLLLLWQKIAPIKLRD
jgi:N-acetylmuramoyl-L-alanine amidase CwlA